MEQLKDSVKVLVVEDDKSLREAMCDTLQLAGVESHSASHAEQALELMQTMALDMVVSDVNMPGMDGLELLKRSRRQYPHLPFLLVTAFGSISKSVEAMRSGAVDYLVKPFEPDVLLDLVNKHALATAADGDRPVAEATSSKQLLQLAGRVAATDATVFVSGESGTGKEVLARYVHNHSPRADGPFVALNCAAIPETMLESILFGHEKGAFTGAHQSVAGKFEQANGGTLLLDEISEMELGLQAKLLRVLQEREVERIGGKKVIALNVRIIATSNRDMQQTVAAGEFREDLFYRLNVFPLHWLPLRERVADIVPLAKCLIDVHSVKMGRTSADLDDGARQVLCNYAWPGNIRELDNVMQRALILQPGTLISSGDLCMDSEVPVLEQHATPNTEHDVSQVLARTAKPAAGLGQDLKNREFQLIFDTLKEQRGNRTFTAKKLGISARTLRYKLAKMRDHGINVDETRVA
ncbi:MAG: sigma-54-dependent transcriptional regulator [Pseudomonadales bacterium]